MFCKLPEPAGALQCGSLIFFPPFNFLIQLFLAALLLLAGLPDVLSSVWVGVAGFGCVVLVWSTPKERLLVANTQMLLSS